MSGRVQRDHSIQIVLLSMVALLWAGAGPVAAQERQFTSEDARGLFIKIVVGRERTVLTLVPVSLDDGTYGAPLQLRGAGDVRIDGPRGAGVHYAGYYLDPGDYAVISMDANLSQAGWDSRTVVCFAQFSAVLSVRAGEAAYWVIVPPSLTTWPAYHERVTNESYSVGLERFRRSVAELPNIRPAAIQVVPTAFVDFTGETPVDARRCEPQFFEVVHRVEE